jgi:hypothetical protein
MIQVGIRHSTKLQSSPPSCRRKSTPLYCQHRQCDLIPSFVHINRRMSPCKTSCTARASHCQRVHGHQAPRPHSVRRSGSNPENGEWELPALPPISLPPLSRQSSRTLAIGRAQIPLLGRRPMPHIFPPDVDPMQALSDFSGASTLTQLDQVIHSAHRAPLSNES